jgi:hypothetical protein
MYTILGLPELLEFPFRGNNKKISYRGRQPLLRFVGMRQIKHHPYDRSGSHVDKRKTFEL